MSSCLSQDSLLYWIRICGRNPARSSTLRIRLRVVLTTTTRSLDERSDSSCTSWTRSKQITCVFIGKTMNHWVVYVMCAVVASLTFTERRWKVCQEEGRRTLSGLDLSSEQAWVFEEVRHCGQHRELPEQPCRRQWNNNRWQRPSSSWMCGYSSKMVTLLTAEKERASHGRCRTWPRRRLARRVSASNCRLE